MTGLAQPSSSACFRLSLSPAAHRRQGPRNRQEPRPKIGLLMDTLQEEERWQRDRDLFLERAKELDADVLVEAAERDDAKQLQQAESLLERGVQALVVVPHGAEAAGQIVEAAKKRTVPVISYDRLILKADVDLYMSYDNRRVGEQQAQYLRNRAPKGNYILLGGAPTDYNAKLIREGQMAALDDAVKRGDIKIVADPWTPDWQADAAMELTEAALKKARNQVVAVVASNDMTAGGAIRALEKTRAGRQGPRVGPGRQPRRRPPHRHRHADDDRLQAAQTARARRRVGSRADGQGREGRGHVNGEQRHEGGAGAPPDANRRSQGPHRPDHHQRQVPHEGAGVRDRQITPTVSVFGTALSEPDVYRP